MFFGDVSLRSYLCTPLIFPKILKIPRITVGQFLMLPLIGKHSYGTKMQSLNASMASTIRC